MLRNQRAAIFLGLFAISILCAGMAASQPPSPSPSETTQQEQPQPRPSLKGGADNQQSPAPPPIIVHVPPPQKTEAETAEERRERQEKTELDRRLVELTAELAHFTGGLFYATIIVAIATVFLVIATVGLGYFGWHQSRDMKASIAVAVANRRPWATVTEVNVIGQVEFAMGMRIPFELVIRNGGQTPAINLNWNCSTWLRIMGGSPQQLQATFAAELIRDRPARERANVGHLVFPDVPLKTGTLTHMLQLPSDPSGLQIIVVGCLDYRFPGEGTYHQTGFMFQLVRKRTTGDVNDFGQRRTTFHNGEVLQAEEVEFQPFPSGFFAT